MKALRDIFVVLVLYSGMMLLSLPSVAADAPQLVLPTGHTGGVESVVFSPDGKYALSGSGDNTLKFWEADTGELLFTRLHVDDSDWIVVAPDGCYEGSPDGIKLLHYAKDNKSIPIDTSSDPFYTPGLVVQLLNPDPEKGER